MTMPPLAGSPILSTPEQIALEVRAARLFDTAPVLRARTALIDLAATFRQFALPGGSTSVTRAMDAFAFAYILHNLNVDPARPAILWDQNPARLRGDIRVPDSCCKGNNPDNIYRRAPLDPAYRYVLRGRRGGRPAPDMTFSVLPDTAHQETWQQRMLALEDVVCDAAGGFAITLDSDEAGSRANHLRLAPGAVRLTIRESMIDWAHETPLPLSIERVDGSAAPEAPDEAALAEQLAAGIPGFVRHWLGYNDRSFYARPANSLPRPSMPKGGLLTQISAMGNFDVEPGEALIIRAPRLGAAYFSLVAMDPWMRAAEYRTRTGSLNFGQMAPEAKAGWFTAILSLSDPGVHNWIDPEGLGQGAFQIRWQALPKDAVVPEGEIIEVQKVRLAALDAHLPEGMRRVSPSERRAQLVLRRAAHDRRLAI